MYPVRQTLSSTNVCTNFEKSMLSAQVRKAQNWEKFSEKNS